MKSKVTLARIILVGFIIALGITALVHNRLARTLRVVESVSLQRAGQNNVLFWDGENSYVGTLQNTVESYDADWALRWRTTVGGAIQRIVTTANGETLLVGSEDRSVYSVHPDSGEILSAIEVRGRVYDLDVHADTGSILVSAGVSSIRHFISLYDADGRLVWEQDTGIRSQAARFLADSILYGTDRGEVVRMNMAGREQARLRLDGQVTVIESYDNARALVGTDRGSLYLFDAALNQERGLRGPARARAISVDTEIGVIAVGTADRAIHLLSIESGKQIETYGFDNQVTDISPGRDDFLVAARDSAVYTMDRAALARLPATLRSRLIIRILTAVLGLLSLVSAWFAFPSVSRRLGDAAGVVVKHRTPYLMLLPIFFLLIVFHYYPVIRALGASFTDWNVHDPIIRFNGLENFRLMVSEGYFLGGVRNLALILVAAMVKLFTMPLLAAKLVYYLREPGKRVFRLLFVLPMVIPAVIGALIWQNIYDPNIGLLNNLLEAVGLDHLQQVWLGNEKTAIWSIIGMGFPFIDAFPFLVYYGGLISIPSELFEASKLDGANGWWNFWKIQIPLISPQIKLLVILSFITIVQDFAPILILTGGGPGKSTYVPGLELYYNITRFGRFGYASALGLVMFAVILGGTLLNLRIRTSSQNEL